MKLTPDQLPSQLSKGLASVYFVTGNEPLIVGETIDAIRAEARRQGFEERESHAADGRFDWDTVTSGLDNLSLFYSRKIVEVRLVTGKPGKQGGAAIVDIISNLPPDTLFIFSSPQIDKRTAGTKWAKSLQTAGVWVEVRPLPREQLPAWIGKRMRAAGLECDPEGLEIMAARTEGNLLAAQQEISKLELLADDRHITADIVRNSVADGARFDVFQLADAAVGQEAARAIRILYGLRKEGIAAPLTLWALAKEANALANLWSRLDQGMPLPRAMSDARIWQSRQGMYTKALRAHNEASIRQLIVGAGLVDRTVKGARHGQPWNALLELVLLIAQPGRSTIAAKVV